MSAPGPDWFCNPDRAFRTAAFWFWHRIPTAEEIRSQVADMKAKGLGAVMIQSRPALGLDAHLSPDYISAYRLASEEIRRHGLGLTIYDDYGWMSGHGGGRTVRGADHLRERHLFWTSAPAGRDQTMLTISNIRSPFLDFLGEVGRSWLYDGGASRWSDWVVDLVVAHPDAVFDETAIQAIESVAAITEAGPVACRIVLDHPPLPAGTIITAFVSARCITSHLINYLLPEAAARFAEIAYTPLVAAAGPAAEDLFFDHPHAGFYLWDEHKGPLGNSLLHDGTRIPNREAAALLSLTRDVGPNTAALRAGFLEGYAQRLHEAFFGTLSRWAADRGLGFTGHELLTHVGGWALHDGLTGFDPRVMPGVDYFGIDRYRSTTTVDAADFAPQLSAKLGDSVARAHGRRRCSLEQYATGRPSGRPTLAGCWDLTAATFRAQAIRHHLFGARRVILHAVNVTDGSDDDSLLVNPRFDFAPAYNFEPWWEDFPAIAEELARLSAFFEDGEPLRTIALLYPLETIRVEGPGHATGRHFGWWAEALARAGLGYDIVDETMLRAVTEPGTRYRTLILPSVTAFRAAVSHDAIAGFVDRGGALLVSGSTPVTTRDGGTMASFLAASPPEKRRVVHAPDADREGIARLVGTIDRPRPSMRFDDDGPTWCAISQSGAEVRIAVFNDADVPRPLRIETDQNVPDVVLWDAATGTLSETLSVDLRAAPLMVGTHQLLCMTLVPRAKLQPSSHAIPFEALRPTPAAETVDIFDSGWTLQLDGLEPQPIAVDRGWEAQGWPAFSGTGIYRRHLTIPPLPDGMVRHLLLPGLSHTAEILINGTLTGRHLAGEARFALPSSVQELAIELRVRNTGANRYYSGRAFDAGRLYPSGLTEPPRLVTGAVTPEGGP